MGKRHQPRPLRYDKSRHVKLSSFYDNKLIEEADQHKVTVSRLLRRIIQAHVHIRMAKEKNKESESSGSTSEK